MVRGNQGGLYRVEFQDKVRHEIRVTGIVHLYKHLVSYSLSGAASSTKSILAAGTDLFPFDSLRNHDTVF